MKLKAALLSLVLLILQSSAFAADPPSPLFKTVTMQAMPIFVACSGGYLRGAGASAAVCDATIQLGALPTEVARKDQANTWTLAQTFSQPPKLPFTNCYLKGNGTSSSSTCDELIVSDNTTLKAVSIAGRSAGYMVSRLGFTSAFDGGYMQYYLSLSACPISGGNDFTQVAPNTGTGCWLAAPSYQGYDLRAAGLIPGDTTTNATANAAALTKVFAETSGYLVVVPETPSFRLACGTQYAAASGLKLYGAGNGGTLKFNTGCSWTGDVFKWDGKSGGGFKNVTIDTNSPAIPGALYGVVAARASTADIDGFAFENSKIINGNTLAGQVIGYASGGHTLSNFVVKNSYFQMTADTTQNQCILLAFSVGAGSILNPLVESNTCVGSGIQLHGTHPIARYNDVSGFKFGSGIFTVPPAPPSTTYTTTSCDITDNYIHDTGAGLDANNTAHEGIEDHCQDSGVHRNRIMNVGGSGIVTFAGGASFYTQNFIKGVGKGYDASAGNRNAIWLAKGVSADPNAAGNTTWIGNVVQDDGSVDGSGIPAMLTGFRVESNVVGQISGKDNQVNISSAVDGSGHLRASRFVFTNPNTAISVDPQLINFSQKISTNASSVAAMTWAPLDNSFKNFYLNCRNVFPDTTADKGMLQVSEDGGGTWKTAATYVTTGFDWNNGVASAVLVTTGTGIQIGNTTWQTNQAKYANFRVHCSDLGNSTAKKSCRYYDADAQNSTNAANLQMNGSGYWNGDAGAIDGLRLLMSLGNVNMFGSCVLSGEL